MASPEPTAKLDAWNEDELLEKRICDLPLQWQGTWLEECVQQLYAELAAKGLTFKPRCYLADEWLTPEGEPEIGIPFYLAHPALTALEKKMMLDAEGSNKEWCMKLLRHEAGHAYSYAYQLQRKKGWRKVFGPSEQEYGDAYHFQPYSKQYVRHLDGFYAQYHPDEDFVETFAVWLTPDSDWENRYRGWKALDKLKFVDSVMQDIKGRPPVKGRGRQWWNAKSLRITLKNFYKRRRVEKEEEFPDFHDRVLLKIFHSVEESEYNKLRKLVKKQSDAVLAADFLAAHKIAILNQVSRHTGERKYIVNDVLKAMIRRCRQLRMVMHKSPTESAIHISAYVTSIVMNYSYTGFLRGERKINK